MGRSVIKFRSPFAWHCALKYGSKYSSNFVSISCRGNAAHINDYLFYFIPSLVDIETLSLFGKGRLLLHCLFSLSILDSLDVHKPILVCNHSDCLSGSLGKVSNFVYQNSHFFSFHVCSSILFFINLAYSWMTYALRIYADFDKGFILNLPILMYIKDVVAQQRLIWSDAVPRLDNSYCQNW